MENPFKTLADGLKEIHNDIIAVDGNGEQIRLMGKAEGFFPDAARKILEFLGEILSWGYEHMVKLVDLLEQVDAAVAIFEVALGMIKAIKEISFDAFMQDTNYGGEPFGGAKEIFHTAGELIENTENALTYVPSPDDVDIATTEIRNLLGENVSEWKTSENAGSLGTLYQQIQTSN